MSGRMEGPALLLIENGEVLAPEPSGRTPVLLAGTKIARIGAVDPAGAEALGLDLDVIDARGCWVTPGLVDPHAHLTGGSGEEGFASRSPAIQLSELLRGGTTTVVGCLGVDATTRSLIDLLACVNGLDEQGISAFMYTGSYDIPPVTLTGGVRDDLLIVDKVIGVGEIAVSDERAPQPEVRDLARVVIDAKVGGMLSGKAGVTHFHLGSQPEKMAPLRALIDDYHIDPALLYPAHVHRSEELIDEAVDLSRRGSYVDMDAIEEELGRCIRLFLEKGGDLRRLTLSSDADGNAPEELWRKVRQAVRGGLPFERLLPSVTANAAQVLKLSGKGRLAPGCDADVLVVRRESLEIVHVIAKGRHLVRDGKIVEKEEFLAESKRSLVLQGEA
jgi:beta-aspartyl-dipeptidase (metallo-type)